MLENFRRNFSPGPTDCPWVSEDDDSLASSRVLELWYMNLTAKQFFKHMYEGKKTI